MRASSYLACAGARVCGCAGVRVCAGGLDNARLPGTGAPASSWWKHVFHNTRLPDNQLFALWGVGVVVEACRGSWTVSWDDDRTQEFTLGASSTKTRMQFGYPNFLQRPKTLQFQRCDFNV